MLLVSENHCKSQNPTISPKFDFDGEIDVSVIEKEFPLCGDHESIRQSTMG